MYGELVSGVLLVSSIGVYGVRSSIEGKMISLRVVKLVSR